MYSFSRPLRSRNRLKTKQDDEQQNCETGIVEGLKIFNVVQVELESTTCQVYTSREQNFQSFLASEVNYPDSQLFTTFLTARLCLAYSKSVKGKINTHANINYNEKGSFARSVRKTA